MRTRSMLYGPAARLDFVEKFMRAGADIGVLDLEDATPPSRKEEARRAIADAAPGAGDLGHMSLFVRINGLELGCLAEDVEAAARALAHGIIAPKMERAEDVATVRSAMIDAGLTNARLCAGIESALGVHHAVEISAGDCDLTYFGAEDFITDMGGVRTASNDEVAHARSHVALAARLGEIPALDQVVIDYSDSDRFVSEAAGARSLGYAGKMCIHPNQVALANAAFTPSPAEISWAEGVLEAAKHAEETGAGVFSYEGTMVDAPIIVRAQRILGI